MANLEYVGPSSPYFYIGDSHAGAIGSHVFRAPESDALISTALISIWRFVAADMLDADGLVSETVMQPLRRTGAFHSSTSFQRVAGLRPVRTFYGNQQQTEYLEVTQSSGERPYVLFVGEINVRYLLKQLCDDQLDFDVPFSIDGLATLPAYEPVRTLTADGMLKLLLSEFQPLIKAVRILKDAGLRTLFLHPLAPPTIDDDDALRVYKHASPARLRYKLTMFVNFLYEAVCKEIGIGFINLWPKVTQDNLLRPEFYLDGLHLNAEHSKLSVMEDHRQLLALSAAAGIPNT